MQNGGFSKAAAAHRQRARRAAKKGAIRFTPQLGIFVVLWLIEKQNRVIRAMYT